MNWLSFFIGVLVGWLVEWLIDVFFWRRRSRRASDEELLLREFQARGETRVRPLETQPPEREAQLQARDEALRSPSPLATPQGNIGAGGSDLATRAEGATLMASTPSAIPPLPDDLTRIEGIGPKIAQILEQHGIATFAQLASTDEARLACILQEAGPHFRLADPGSWPEQASLAASGEYEALRVLQERLTAGREEAA